MKKKILSAAAKKNHVFSFLAACLFFVLALVFPVYGLLSEFHYGKGLSIYPILRETVLILVSVFFLIFLAKYRYLKRTIFGFFEEIGHDPVGSLDHVIAEFREQIDRLALIDRDHHLIRLLKDCNPNLQPIIHELKHYGVDFRCEGFFLVGFDACHLQAMNPPRNFRLRDQQMKELIENATPEGMDAYILDLEDLYVCMFNIPYTEEQQERKDIKKTAETFAETVIGRVDAAFGIHTSATISELHKGVHSLESALREVQGLFEYKKITGNPSPIIQYSDYYVSFDSWYEFGNTYHKFDEVKRLITSIHVGDFANAKLLINELIENDYSRLYPSLLLARCRLYGIIDAAINAMGLLKDELDYEFLKEMDHSTRIVKCGSYAELQGELDTIFDEIIGYYNSKKKDTPPQWFETIKQYIDTHYNDVNMNVATIAEYFNISSAYYARVFKKYMGISPLDYIHKQRMDNAKQLMSRGVSVKDAAVIVGYGNPITMSRAFKRYEGLTPGSFLKHS